MDAGWRDEAREAREQIEREDQDGRAALGVGRGHPVEEPRLGRAGASTRPRSGRANATLLHEFAPDLFASLLENRIGKPACAGFQFPQ